MATKHDVWKWLNGDDKNYYEGVTLVEEIAPDEVLLPNLKTGISFMNRRYLEKVLDKIFKNFPENSIKNEVNARPSHASPTEIQEKKELTHQDYHRIAEDELAKAYVERRKLSNQFHKCNSDEERANVSRQIKAKIAEIGELKSRIAVFKETGIMPAKPSASDEFAMPADDADLLKAIQNFRSKVSSQKRLLNKYDSQPRTKSKAEHEYRLTQLQNHVKNLVDERNRRSQK